MQPCWPTCEPESSTDHSSLSKDSIPCRSCFEPSNPIIITSIAPIRFNRQFSGPLSVPGSPDATPLMNNTPQAHEDEQSFSSGYESGFGNGLSPTANYWKSGQSSMLRSLQLTFFLASGVYDVASPPSSTSDDLQQEFDGSVFEEVSNGTAGAPDEQMLDEDDEDDLDGFEVLSFNAPPESSLFFKGMIQKSTVVLFSNAHCSFV
jgi:hypothetical protein